MRIFSPERGNPDTDASRSLNHRVTSRLYPSLRPSFRPYFVNPYRGSRPWACEGRFACRVVGQKMRNEADTVRENC
jgi:hypothetical protein